ncbi:ABC transporter ATP-binding protein [Paenibacillus pini]|uniref:Ferrichrome transport ATP-binding protein FhuC n=1 Tax=Paenibacillus pini JCM 16418 TaxID=1236976 RepID=W7Z0P2_9BACL|nr:ABC transporter ATP-binding protein [Paenibacillus pini]GAF10551.1 ferrichrome transport ATP-binding protein FhuC [Paenibacillus pini JCM 16418]
MLEAEALTISYDGKQIVNEFNLHVREGEIVSIIGPNGSGKSTLLKGISRLIPCESGRVCIAGQELQSMQNKQISQLMCILCQSNQTPADMTVEELVSYGRFPHKKWYERLTADDYEIVDWAIEKTGLHDFRKRLVISLSGGEAQRAWIAMALAQRPKVLLLDEPTTYLDIAHQLEVLELVKSVNKELGITVVMVLHDLNQASAYSDSICVIQKGNLAFTGTPSDVLTEGMIRDVYGVEAEVQYVDNHTYPRIHPIKKATQLVAAH